MPEELYTSRDFCELAEKFEELKRENEELVSDKTYLINAAMDGGDKYHYTAHDIAYRDLERKCKALEAENAAMKKDLKARIAELEAEQRWIPVGERLPEESDWTLIRYKGYRVPYTLYYDIDRGWACGETPDYWMSLPEMQEVNNE